MEGCFFLGGGLSVNTVFFFLPFFLWQNFVKLRPEKYDFKPIQRIFHEEKQASNSRDLEEFFFSICQDF
jgi:hypothetical protein